MQFKLLKRYIAFIGISLGLLTSGTPLHAIWQMPPDTVSNPNLRTSSQGGPVLRVNPLGNAIAVWPIDDENFQPDELAIQSSFYTRGFGWSPPVTISSLALNPFGNPLYTGQADPSIAFDSTGYAVAVWEGQLEDDNFPAVIIAARRSSTGIWSPVEIISDQSGDFFADDTNVSMNQAGTALAAWRSRQLNENYDVTQVSFLPFGGSWTTPFSFTQEEPLGGNNKPYPFINANGDAVVTWLANVPSSPNFEIRAATYDSQTLTWSAPVTLDVDTVSSLLQFNPRSAMDDSGNAVAAWLHNGFMKVAYFNGTAWEPTLTLGVADNPPGIFVSATAVIDPRGNGYAVAVWPGPGPDYPIFASSRLPDGSWTTPQVISRVSDNTFAPWMSQEPLAINQEGDVIATWAEGITQQNVVAAFKPFGQDWRAPELVFSSFQNAYLNIGLASCGFAVDLWSDFSTVNNVVKASVNENLLLVQDGNATVRRCCQKFATQKRCVNILSFEDPCALFFNIYRDGVLIATVLNTGGVVNYVDPLSCSPNALYTISIISLFGVEGEQVPFIFN